MTRGLKAWVRVRVSQRSPVIFGNITDQIAWFQGKNLLTLTLASCHVTMPTSQDSFIWVLASVVQWVRLFQLILNGFGDLPHNGLSCQAICGSVILQDFHCYSAIGQVSRAVTPIRTVLRAASIVTSVTVQKLSVTT